MCCSSSSTRSANQIALKANDAVFSVAPRQVKMHLDGFSSITLTLCMYFIVSCVFPSYRSMHGIC